MRRVLLKRCYSALVVSDPFLHYQSLISVNHFRKDDAQLRAVKELQKLYRRIDGYEPPIDFARKIKQVEKLLRKDDSIVKRIFSSASDKSLVRQLSWEDELLNCESPRGLLLSGSVGTGKSMLIDMLLPMKKRWHYNAFMLDIFARLNRDRDDEHILLKIAYELIEESPVLAIDEFQLSDPASARIMKGLLIYFWKMGGVLVATSNRMPEDLYSGSFQADQYRSFTELLNSRCVVHDMRSGRDFRREVDAQLTHYHTDLPAAQVAELMPVETSRELTIYSRKLTVPSQYNMTAKFDFAWLCESDLGPADYITIASTYSTIIILSVPILTLRKKNEARRFISLIDALYESKCKLLIQAAALPEGLFFPDGEVAHTDSIAAEAFSETYYDTTAPNRPNVSAYTSQERPLPSVDLARDFSRLNAFTGQDELFAFKRASSRLHELTSLHWWTTATHQPSADRTWELKQRRLPEPLKATKLERIRKGPKFDIEHFWRVVTRNGKRAPTNPSDWI